tara:strand:- start:162 stop:803 length:642 start_codon:yes stop_codon:yes gene_type:complete
MVNDDNCGAFVSCYSTKAINAMPKNLLIQFAKDIKAGKSRAIDSYSITNGKELGEDCIEEILNVPENVDININSAGSGETISPEEMEYIIDEDIGAFVYDKPGKIDTVGRNSISYMAFYYLNGVSESENSALATIEVFPDTASRESYFDTWISSQSINSEKTIDGLKVYDITSSIDDRFDRKRSVWITDNFVVRISEPKTRQDILNAYIGKYS